MPNTHDPQAQGRWVCGGPSQPACRGLMGLEEPWGAGGHSRQKLFVSCQELPETLFLGIVLLLFNFNIFQKLPRTIATLLWL